MGRRAQEPLEKKDIILFKGDWDELTAVLAPRKIKPTVFIRALVRQKLRQIQAAVNQTAKPVEIADVNLGDLEGADDESIESSGPDESAGDFQSGPGDPDR